jgi:hypothetical protein
MLRPILLAVLILIAENAQAFNLFATPVSTISIGIDELYGDTSKLKCPFMRRRATDAVDNLASIWKFLLARHKSLPLYEIPGCRPIDTEVKSTNLAIVDVADIIYKDWGRNGKGYYITGLLTKSIYRDDCFFDGPDPDMPVRGLRKYLSATSQLFDRKKSRADVCGLQVDSSRRCITVSWRIEGILNLPWHPMIKPWSGQTVYHLDDSSLISSHVESWDITVPDAFLSTLFPQLRYGAPPAPAITTAFEYMREQN